MDLPMRFVVHGTPAPQGSKRHVGGGRMIESSKAVAPWREAVHWQVRQQLPADWQPLDCAVLLTLTFELPRPKSAKKKALPAKRPDLDKMIRSTCDSLTQAGVYTDDSRVVGLNAFKLYIGDPDPDYPSRLNSPGVVITVTAVVE